MATSNIGYYTRFDESLVDDEDPVDTGLSYRAVNNLNHLADQYGQHRVSWVMSSGQQGIRIDASDVNGPRTFLYKSLAFDLHVREDGSTYPCALWLRVQSNHVFYQARYYAVLVPAPVGADYAEDEMYEAGVNYGSTSSTSTSFTWQLTTPNTLYLDAFRARRAIEDTLVRDAVGGAEVGVRWLRVQLCVFSESSGISEGVGGGVTGALAELGGVRLIEYMAP